MGGERASCQWPHISATKSPSLEELQQRASHQAVFTCVPLPEPGPPSTKTMLRSFFAGVVDPRSEMPPVDMSCGPGERRLYRSVLCTSACHLIDSVASHCTMVLR
jgi:hypothetical protein